MMVGSPSERGNFFPYKHFSSPSRVNPVKVTQSEYIVCTRVVGSGNVVREGDSSPHYFEAIINMYIVNKICHVYYLKTYLSNPSY